MAYATPDLLFAVGVGEKALAKFTPTQIDAALAAASGAVDLYLKRAGYVLPLSTPSPVLGRWNAVIAAYDLMVARGYNAQLAGDVELRMRFRDTIDELKSLTGDDGLDLDDTTADSGLNAAPVVVSNVVRGYLDEEQQS